MSALRTFCFNARTASDGVIFAALMLGVVGLGVSGQIRAASAQQRMPVAAPVESSSRAEAASVEVSRTPYQAFILGDCLTGGNFCKYETEIVSPRRRLELRRVACQGWHTNTVAPNFVTIGNLQTAAGVFVRRIDFLETHYTRVDTNSVWSISEPVLTFIPAGHRLQIALNSATVGVGSYGCSLSGYMVTLGRE